MAKKNRKKHYTQYQVSQETNQSPASTNVTATENKTTAVYNAHAEEYKNISGDLVKVIIINVLFLGAMLALYYINRSQPFLDSWYNKIF